MDCEKKIPDLRKNQLFCQFEFFGYDALYEDFVGGVATMLFLAQKKLYSKGERRTPDWPETASAWYCMGIVPGGSHKLFFVPVGTGPWPDSTADLDPPDFGSRKPAASERYASGILL